MLRSEEKIEKLPVEDKIFKDKYFNFTENNNRIVFDNCVFINCNISFNSDTKFLIRNSWVCGLGCDDAKRLSFENCYLSDNDGRGGQETILSTRRTPTRVENSYISCGFSGQVFIFRESEKAYIKNTKAMSNNSGSLLGLTLGTSFITEDCFLSGFSFVFLLLDDSKARIVRTSGEDIERWIVAKDSSTVEIEDSPKLTKELVSNII